MENSSFSDLFRELFEAWEARLEDAKKRYPRTELANRCRIDKRTVSNWLDGKVVPRPQALDWVVAEFSACGGDRGKLDALKRSCAAARSGNSAGTSTSGGGRAAGFRATPRRKTPIPALVNLSLDKPPQGSTPQDFAVLASLSFGVSRVEEGDFKADIGLKQAQLVTDAVACHAKVNSQYGQDPKRDGIVDPPAGNRSRFIGPRNNDDDVLYGEPPGLAVLAEMQSDGPSCRA